MVYKWYILLTGGLFATYHLLGEPETIIDYTGPTLYQVPGTSRDAPGSPHGRVALPLVARVASPWGSLGENALRSGTMFWRVSEDWQNDELFLKQTDVAEINIQKRKWHFKVSPMRHCSQCFQLISFGSCCRKSHRLWKKLSPPRKMVRHWAF